MKGGLKIILLLAAGIYIYNLPASQYRDGVPVDKVTPINNIGDMYSYIDRLDSKPVALKAVVSESFSLVGWGGYRLRDGAGSIWVMTHNIPPAPGQYIEVWVELRSVGSLNNMVGLIAKEIEIQRYLTDSEAAFFD